MSGVRTEEMPQLLTSNVRS